MKEIDEIRLILKEFKPFEPKSNDYVNILDVNYNPSAYIVQILLLGILELKHHGIMDKIKWHTYFQYKNHSFMIRDYKFDTWTIEAEKKDEVIVRLAKEIQNKIVEASKLFKKMLKSDLEKGNFYLSNVYPNLSSVYNFYKEKILSTVKEYEAFKNDKENRIKILDSADFLNKDLSYGDVISKYLFALIISFFSLLEFIIDSVCVFEKTDKQFFEFKKKKWQERFKLVFNFDKNRELEKLFDELVCIKRNYRNPLVHGLTNEVNILVSFPLVVGLVPVSYGYLSHETVFGFELRKDDALNIIDTFQKFLNFLRNKEPYNFYMLYLDWGFPIPVNEYEISKIKKEMTTYAEFEKYLEYEAMYRDAIMNRDIM